jgi:hypothetical protein
MQGIQTMIGGLAVLYTQLYGKIMMAQLDWYSDTSVLEWHCKGYHLGLKIVDKNPDDVNEVLCEEYIENLRQIMAESEKYDDAIDYQVSSLKAVHQAFVEICNQEGLTTDHLNKWFDIGMHIPQLEENLNMGGTADEDMLVLYKKAFIKLLNSP